MKVYSRTLVLLLCVLLLHSVELLSDQNIQQETSKESIITEDSSRELSEVNSNILSENSLSIIVTKIADDVVSGLLDILSSICGFSVSEDVPPVENSNEGLVLHYSGPIQIDSDDDGLIDELI